MQHRCVVESCVLQWCSLAAKVWVQVVCAARHLLFCIQEAAAWDTSPCCSRARGPRAGEFDSWRAARELQHTCGSEQSALFTSGEWRQRALQQQPEMRGTSVQVGHSTAQHRGVVAGRVCSSSAALQCRCVVTGCVCSSRTASQHGCGCRSSVQLAYSLAAVIRSGSAVNRCVVSFWECS